MIDRVAGRGRTWVPAIALCVLAGCGGSAGLSISNPKACGGGKGPQVHGVVLMPHGRVAQAPTLFQRLASLIVAPVDALSGGTSPVGSGITVELVELRPENLSSGTEPGILETTTTNGKGEFCVGLREGTDQSVCRYVIQVGNQADHTLTRAFVFATDEAIDIDYRSEATVRVVINDIPPATLCDFDPEELRDVYQAVLDAPGTVDAADADEANAVAASIAASDAGVRAALAAGADLPPTPPPTNTAGPVTATPTGAPASATPTGPRPTATHTFSVPTRSGRATRTPQSVSPSPTRTSGATRTATATALATNTAPAPTATRPAATNTAAAPTATRAPATNTVAAATATRPAATATPTAIAPTPTPTAIAPTPTPTATVMAAAALGERLFTIREDSMFPPQPPAQPRTGFFSSGLGGNSVSDKFSSGPLMLVGGVPNASGIASLQLKEDAYFKINVPPGSTALCVRMLAAGSSGTIDCDGGTPYGISLTEPSGQSAPGTPMTGQGTDSGAGAAQLAVMQSIAEIGMFDKPCDATVTFGAPTTAIYTTATFTAKKGAAQIAKSGENFSCATWTMTDGPGMLVTGVVGFDARAGGNAANATRIADN